MQSSNNHSAVMNLSSLKHAARGMWSGDVFFPPFIYNYIHVYAFSRNFSRNQSDIRVLSAAVEEGSTGECYNRGRSLESSVFFLKAVRDAPVLMVIRGSFH